MNWWDTHSNEEEFVGWVGKHDAESKKFARKYVASNGYESILDCGAGFCSEFYGYRQDKYKIKYTALDECERFIERAKKRRITCSLGSVDAIPFEDSAFDIVFMRHVLEHLPSYQKAVDEMIRTAKKEVGIIFFIKPQDKTEIRYDAEVGLYHNIYSRNELLGQIFPNPKVAKVTIEQINDAEEMWHIILK